MTLHEIEDRLKQLAFRMSCQDDSEFNVEEDFNSKHSAYHRGIQDGQTELAYELLQMVEKVIG